MLASFIDIHGSSRRWAAFLGVMQMGLPCVQVALGMRLRALNPSAPNRVCYGKREDMPKNRFIYFGILIVAATALLWLGAEILTKIVYIFPWTAGVGALLIVIGVLMEARKPKESVAEEPKEGE
jgi:hypothetical protein